MLTAGTALHLSPFTVGPNVRAWVRREFKSLHDRSTWFQAGFLLLYWHRVASLHMFPALLRDGHKTMKLPALAGAILLAHVAIVAAQGDSTSNTTTIPYRPPVTLSWAALGDSFAAGIGAGTDVDDSGSCRRRTGAYPLWLNVSRDLISTDHAFDFLACSGGTTDDVLNSQLPEFSTTGTNQQQIVTLSIGGNDVGFARILDACITKAWNTDCDDQLQAAPTTIAGVIDKLVTTYTGILDAVQNADGTPGFRLIVTGWRSRASSCRNSLIVRVKAIPPSSMQRQRRVTTTRLASGP